jgi:hypothetical protein
MTSIEPGEIALTVKHSPDNGNVVPDSVATDENDGTPVLVSNKNSFGLVESFLRDKAQVKWMAMNHQLREASMLFEHRGKKESVGGGTLESIQGSSWGFIRLSIGRWKKTKRC